MLTTMLTLDDWDRLEDTARLAWARAALERVDCAAFELVGLHDHALGRASHRVLELRLGDAAFVLVPGGERVVGFDADRGWHPDPGELESWRTAAQDYGLDPAPSTHLARVLTPRRHVVVPPKLVEVHAREIGFQRVDPADPRVAPILAEHARSSGVTTVDGDGIQVRIRRSQGVQIVELAEETTHEDVVADLAREGFRPPTPDEWEHLCGAGTETLFRWGDHAPTDRYPIDVSLEEATWRQQWALSGGRLARPAEGFVWTYDLHRRPNALGLTIAFDPYRFELTSDPCVLRGGDGGTSVCGGAGFFLGWLPLATAYFERELCGAEEGAPITPGYTYVRRCLCLSA